MSGGKKLDSGDGSKHATRKKTSFFLLKRMTKRKEALLSNLDPNPTTSIYNASVVKVYTATT
jgi:hypothetical protein